MNKFGIAIHGGAGDKTEYLQKHQKEYEKGLHDAVMIGFKILKKGGSALTAVEASVRNLEDNPLFNAGCGSALNSKCEVEMDASIMDGKNLKAGAISMVKNVKNPISLARLVMSKTHHVMLSGYGALEFAVNNELPMEKNAYFITEHQYEEFIRLSKNTTRSKLIKKQEHGTVGAVALDQRRNLAAGTSTGGISNSMPGRIGDSCIIGAGCYANNKSCAISGTGEGEFLITGVIAHSISMYLELKKCKLQEACEYVIHKRNKLIKNHIGIISISNKGDFGIAFNTKIMKHAWIGDDGNVHVKIAK